MRAVAQRGIVRVINHAVLPHRRIAPPAAAGRDAAGERRRADGARRWPPGTGQPSDVRSAGSIGRQARGHSSRRRARSAESCAGVITTTRAIASGCRIELPHYAEQTCVAVP
jgi:hypothetical protein